MCAIIQNNKLRLIKLNTKFTFRDVCVDIKIFINAKIILGSKYNLHLVFFF
jgi:hypothetical protein